MTLASQDLIFIFSLPRSGSTLLQRIIGQGPQVHTVSEPWVLLPLLAPFRPEGHYAEYSVRSFNRAFEHLTVDGEPYRSAVRDAALKIYDSMVPAGSDGVRFLDKTPRYAYMAREIVRTFPDSRIIILWRNPLAVATSIMQTWNEARWNLYNYRVDLYCGAGELLRLQQDALENVASFRYEDLVSEPESTCRQIWDHLELPFDADVIEKGAATRLSGRYGDRTGQERYRTISAEPTSGRHSLLANPLRRRWAGRYLEWLGDDALWSMGYDPAALRASLARTPASTTLLGSDVARMAWGQLVVWTEPQILRSKLSSRGSRPALRHS